MAVPVRHGQNMDGRIKDPFHFHDDLQSWNPDLVVALRFVPGSISTALKVAYYARSLARIIGIGATATLAGVLDVNHFFISVMMALGYIPGLWSTTGCDVRELPRPIGPRCALLISVLVWRCRHWNIQTLHFLRLARVQLVRRPLFRRGSLASWTGTSKIITRTMRCCKTVC
jgi:hypothetical protein